MDSHTGEVGPLISCLMPTYNRREFLPGAIACFQRQTHANRELIVLDDGEDAVGDLIPDDPRIHYERLPARITLGAKLNLGCEMARGDLIAHFDDDDWYAPWRLAYQVQAMAEAGADLCGINRLLYYDLRHGRGYEYRYPPGHPVWLLGSDMLYTPRFWRERGFADVNVGMDGLFAWSAAPGRALALDRHDFAVHMIHGGNISPKQVDGQLWCEVELGRIVETLGDDWHDYARPPAARVSMPARAKPASCTPAPTLRNVHACLVHEAPECVIDLVSNLAHCDPGSRILLYDGSAHGTLLDPRLPWSRWGAEICPSRRPMRWGRLHGFALDCLRHLGRDFDTLTIVDSDQMALRSGYSDYLARHGGDRSDVGIWASRADRQGPDTTVAPCVTAQAEIELWRPFLRRFAGGEDKFVHWSFWPGTVIARDAGLAVLDLFDRDTQLAAILARSKMWATEEILFPTLAALLGYRVEENPCAGTFTRFRAAYSPGEIRQALATPAAFFIHPVPRAYADPIRVILRATHGQYRTAPPPAQAQAPLLVSSILRAIRTVDGWLEDEEAEVLALTVRDVVERAAGAAVRIVEIGAFCGKATLVMGMALHALNAPARILAIDRFDGVVGTRERHEHHGPTLARFRQTLARGGIEGLVDIAIGGPDTAQCSDRVALLLIDGLHDHASVA
jgi:hypothetical protein